MMSDELYLYNTDLYNLLRSVGKAAAKCVNHSIVMICFTFSIDAINKSD